MNVNYSKWFRAALYVIAAITCLIILYPYVVMFFSSVNSRTLLRHLFWKDLSPTLSATSTMRISGSMFTGLSQNLRSACDNFKMFQQLRPISLP